MPPVTEILQNVKTISSDFVIVAIAWHLLAYLGIGFFFLQKKRFAIRLIALLMTGPIISVAVISALGGNIFNAIVFTALSLALVIISFTLPKQTLIFHRQPLYLFSGIVLLTAGLLYPHFVDDNRFVMLVAPIGLIPCPTLLLVSGQTLICGPLPRRWIGVMIVAVLFYGLFGVFRLGVYIDVLLIAAVIPLTILFIRAPFLKYDGYHRCQMFFTGGKRLVFATIVALMVVLDAYLIYPWICRATASRAETMIAVPGDEIVPIDRAGYTLGITINATAETVWPWLLQMGQSRGGFYTHEWLENIIGARIHNCDSIVLGLQDLSIGDSIPLTPDPYFGHRGQYVTVYKIEKPSLLVYKQILPNGSQGSWSFLLKDLPGNKTRLVFRRRAGEPSSFDRVARPAYYFMDIGMLNGIRERAEKNNK